jgi:hypothetical protein
VSELLYSVDRHLPPRLFASSPISSIVPFRRRHVGHHLPRSTPIGHAVHLCPLRHSQTRCVRLFVYLVERHRPPLAAAILCMCSMDKRRVILSGAYTDRYPPANYPP